MLSHWMMPKHEEAVKQFQLYMNRTYWDKPIMRLHFNRRIDHFIEDHGYPKTAKCIKSKTMDFWFE